MKDKQQIIAESYDLLYIILYTMNLWKYVTDTSIMFSNGNKNENVHLEQSLTVSQPCYLDRGVMN